MRASAAAARAATSGRFAAIEQLVKEWQPARLVVGLPLRERRRAARDDAPRRALRAAARGRFGLPVALVDERSPRWREPRARLRRAQGGEAARGKALDSQSPRN